MNYRPGIWAVLLISLWAAPVRAVNKCIEANGRIFYQNAPCPATARGGDMTLNVNRPVTGQAQGPDLTGATPPITGQVLLPDSDAKPNQTAAPPDTRR